MPKLTDEEAIVIAEMLQVIPFFPTSSAARSRVAQELQSMCASLEQADWLVGRMSRLYQRWPGLLELRAVFCSRFRPVDGVEGYTATNAFPDGIPSERPPEPNYKQLPVPASFAEVMGDAISSLPRPAFEWGRRFESLAKVRLPTGEEISAALAEQRANQAKRDALLQPKEHPFD